MRILATSDLHFGRTRRGDDAVRELAAHVVASDADVLLLGGDIANDGSSLDACLALFEGFPGAKLAVPGNHDVWTRGHDVASSWTIHEELVPAIFRRRGVHSLHLEPVRIGDVAFVGSMGWYDYSFRDELGIELEWYRRKTLPGRREPLWNDARFARFPHDDEALTAVLAERLDEHLDAVSDAVDVVALVHHVVTKELLVHPRHLVPRVFRFANAFLGAERFRLLLERRSNVRLAISGHIHRDASLKAHERIFATIGCDARRRQLLVSDGRRILERRWFSSSEEAREVPREPLEQRRGEHDVVLADLAEVVGAEP